MISKIIIIAVFLVLYFLTDKFILDPMKKRADYFRGEYIIAVRNNETERAEGYHKKWFLYLFLTLSIRMVFLCLWITGFLMTLENKIA